MAPKQGRRAFKSNENYVWAVTAYYILCPQTLMPIKLDICNSSTATVCQINFKASKPIMFQLIIILRNQVKRKYNNQSTNQKGQYQYETQCEHTNCSIFHQQKTEKQLRWNLDQNVWMKQLAQFLLKAFDHNDWLEYIRPQYLVTIFCHIIFGYSVLPGISATTILRPWGRMPSTDWTSYKSCKLNEKNV